MANNYSDLSTGTVLTAPTPATSGTSLVLNSGEGARMPAVPFFATAHPDNVFPTFDNAEIVQVTAKSTDTLTIVRAQKSSSAKEIAVGWRISASIYALDLGQKLQAVGVQTDDNNSIVNLTPTGLKVQGGWGQIVGAAATTITSAVVFPTAFTTVYAVVGNITAATATDSTAATDITDMEVTMGPGFSFSANDIAETGFTATITFTSNFTATRFYGFSWVAIGII